MFKDRAGLKRMVTMTGQYGVPVVQAGEHAMVGWNPAQFEKMMQE